jgi:hypothetical protein
MNLDLAYYKFVCELKGSHLCLPKYKENESYWIVLNERRWILADSLKAAEDYFANLFNNQTYWPKEFHKVLSFKVNRCPYEEECVMGYDRFGNDIRTNKITAEDQIKSIRDKISGYVQHLVDNGEGQGIIKNS